MLYLAQVQRQGLDGKAVLQLLACQKAECSWALIPEESLALPAEIVPHEFGAFVLVDLSSNRQVQEMQDARGWLLEIIEQYLSAGVSPDLLKEEVQRAEQWRQSLTLQSQELGRRGLEMEARRDQIQELEENLKREKQQLENLSQDLNRQALELEMQRDQIQELEENLKREKKRLEDLAAELGRNPSPLQ